MKLIYFFILLTIISTTSFGQTNKWKVDTINKKQTVITVDNNDKAKIAYYHYYNSVIAVSEGISCDSIFLMTDNGKFRKGLSPCHYQWAPDSIGTGVIFACKAVNKDTFILGTSTYRVIRLPDPFTIVAGKTGGSISKESLAEFREIYTPLPGLDPAEYFVIDSFKITVLRDTTILFTKGYNPSLFDEEFKVYKTDIFDKEFNDVCLTLKTGDKILFTEIFASGFDGTKRNLKPMEFKIE